MLKANLQDRYSHFDSSEIKYSSKKEIHLGALFSFASSEKILQVIAESTLHHATYVAPTARVKANRYKI